MKKVYLDYAATTPVDRKVLEEMKPYFSGTFGNAGSLHSFGQEASAAVFESRRKIADVLAVDYSQVVFTGSASEANNLALQGVVKRARESGVKEPKAIVSSMEHESVLEVVNNLGCDVYVIPALGSGQVDLKKLEKAIDKNTILVSVIYANNEVGSVQPIKKIAKIVKEKSAEALIHTDAVQAFQYLDCKPEELGVDLMTLSAHKIYGPKGIGLLYISNPALLSPIIFGGGQEEGLRSGTENVPSIVGFAKAIELADKVREKEGGRVSKLRDWFLAELLKVFPRASVNGGRGQRLPNNININLKTILSEQALTFLDLNGVAVSAGSACSARSLEASKTLLAIGLREKDALSSIRITLGRNTSKEELRKALKVFKRVKKSLG